MKRFIYKISGNDAYHMAEYLGEKLGPDEVVVSFSSDENFKDVIHIDDGDRKCLQMLLELKRLPVITR